MLLKKTTMTTMTTNEEQKVPPYHVAGASVIGYYHREIGKLNEDSIAIFDSREAVVVAVADGVGSAPYAKVGSQRVVQSVYDATKIWLKKGDASKEHLLQLVYALFRLYVSEYDRHDCATTCLFAVYVKKSNRLIIAQIGDGIVFCRVGQDVVVLEEPKTQSINATLPITGIKNVKSWRSFEFDVTNQPFGIFLATDGISECIDQDDYHQFLHSIKLKIQGKERLKYRNETIRHYLKCLPKTVSIDDKTLAIICRGELV